MDHDRGWWCRCRGPSALWPVRRGLRRALLAGVGACDAVWDDRPRVWCAVSRDQSPGFPVSPCPRRRLRWGQPAFLEGGGLGSGLLSAHLVVVHISSSPLLHKVGQGRGDLVGLGATAVI